MLNVGPTLPELYKATLCAKGMALLNAVLVVLVVTGMVLLLSRSQKGLGPG